MSLLREYIQKTLSQIRPPDDSKFSINGIPLDLEVVDTPDKIQYDLLENRTRLIFHTAWELANRKDRIELK